MIRDKFNPDKKKEIGRLMLQGQSHFEEYLSTLDQEDWDTSEIRKTVDRSTEKIKSGVKSFVIYGEPQSGKTAMMIALTSKLIEENHNLIIILVNDSVKLMDQNLNRFIKSSMRPCPRDAMEAYEGGNLSENKNILFCRKNIKLLDKLLHLVEERKKIIIDDEADFATPNGKVNKGDRTAINEAIFKMINEQAIYIGVTATPARIDLNNTFDTENHHWVQFKSHTSYVGKEDIFFEEGLYKRRKIGQNEKNDLEKAVIEFIVNTVYLNCLLKLQNMHKENYCFLIHTSGKKDDHQKDKAIVEKVLTSLSNEDSTHHERYLSNIRKCILQRKEIRDFGEKTFLGLIKKYIPSKEVHVMNSDYDTKGKSTNPEAMFTFYIGGNVVSRGVTFDNLLGMFFTRSAKTGIQQDTYMQRARMFGSRKDYIKFFQLWISEELFKDWQTCFIFHHISLESIRATSTAPIWISSNRLRPVAASSIDKSSILTFKGEMTSKKFYCADIETKLEEVLNCKKISELDRLEAIRQFLPISDFLKVIIKLIVLTSRDSRANINIINTVREVGSHDGEYHDNLFREKGIMGGTDYKKTNKDHHIMFIKNTKGEARMVYRYTPNKLRFFKKQNIYDN